MTSKLHTILVRLFFVLLFISATTMAYVLLPENSNPTNQQTNKPTIIPSVIEESLKPSNSGDADYKGSFVVTQDDKTQNHHNTTTPEQTKIATDLNEIELTPNFQTSTLIAGDKNYTLRFQDGDSLLSAMRGLTASSVSPFLFSGQEYTGMGFFVNEINGIKNNPATGEYWIYYINGKSATVGISNYLLKLGDVIKWQYGQTTL